MSAELEKTSANSGSKLPFNLGNLLVWLALALLGLGEAYHQLEVSQNRDAHQQLAGQVIELRAILEAHMRQDRDWFESQSRENGALEEKAVANRRDIERHDQMLQAEQLEWARSGRILRPPK